MSLEIYKLIHVTSVALLLLGLGSLLGAYSTGAVPEKKWRISMAMVHGVGMTLLLISGFGMLAKLQIMGAFPGWVWAKIVVWLALGGSMVLAKRKAELRTTLLIFWALLVAVAAFMGIFKPF